jgi:hypothetical protein
MESAAAKSEALQSIVISREERRRRTFICCKSR